MQDLQPMPLPLPTPLPRDTCFADVFSRAQVAGVVTYSGWVWDLLLSFFCLVGQYVPGIGRGDWRASFCLAVWGGAGAGGPCRACPARGESANGEEAPPVPGTFSGNHSGTTREPLRNHSGWSKKMPPPLCPTNFVGQKGGGIFLVVPEWFPSGSRVVPQEGPERKVIL